MLVIVVTFCMTLNPSMCRELTIVTAGHVTECIKGGAVSGMRFELEHIDWQTKGWHCEEAP